MAKIKYLIQSGSHKKLKRNVPKRLLKIANKTAWVQSVDKLSNSEIKDKAALFAVRTGAEIERLDRLLDADKGSLDDLLPPTEILSSDIELEQIAIAYFHKENRSRRSLEQYHWYGAQDDQYHEIENEIGNDIGIAARQLSTGRIENLSVGLDALCQAGVVKLQTGSREEKFLWVNSLKVIPKFLTFCDLLAKAELELSHEKLASITGGSFCYSPDPIFKKGHSQSIAKPAILSDPALNKISTIGELTDKFLAEQKENVSISRFDQYKVPVRVLCEFFSSDLSLSEITPQSLIPVVELLPKIPAWVSRHYPDKSLLDASNEYKQTNGDTANRYEEAKKTLQVIRQIFQFGVEEFLIINNPAENHRIKIPASHRKKKYEKKAKTYQPYSIDDLNKIFSSSLYSGREGRTYYPDGQQAKSQPGEIIPDQMYWAPILALWTGMRMNEILQLERADLKRSKNGIAYLTVTDEQEVSYPQDQFSKQLKTDYSVRDIPLHSFLHDVGFVRWAEAVKKGRLFPDAHRGKASKPSSSFSKNYAYFSKSLGVWVSRRKVFHSFRNNFNDELRNSGVLKEPREAINGWAEQKSMDSRYGKGQKIERLYSEICKMKFEAINWAVVKSSHKNF